MKKIELQGTVINQDSLKSKAAGLLDKYKNTMGDYDDLIMAAVCNNSIEAAEEILRYMLKKPEFKQNENMLYMMSAKALFFFVQKFGLKPMQKHSYFEQFSIKELQVASSKYQMKIKDKALVTVDKETCSVKAPEDLDLVKAHLVGILAAISNGNHKVADGLLNQLLQSFESLSQDADSNSAVGELRSHGIMEMLISFMPIIDHRHYDAIIDASKDYCLKYLHAATTLSSILIGVQEAQKGLDFVKEILLRSEDKKGTKDYKYCQYNKAVICLNLKIYQESLDLLLELYKNQEFKGDQDVIISIIKAYSYLDKLEERADFLAQDSIPTWIKEFYSLSALDATKITKEQVDRIFNNNNITNLDLVSQVKIFNHVLKINDLKAKINGQASSREKSFSSINSKELFEKALEDFCLDLTLQPIDISQKLQYYKSPDLNKYFKMFFERADLKGRLGKPDLVSSELAKSKACLLPKEFLSDLQNNKYNGLAKEQITELTLVALSNLMSDSLKITDVKKKNEELKYIKSTVDKYFQNDPSPQKDIALIGCHVVFELDPKLETMKLSLKDYWYKYGAGGDLIKAILLDAAEESKSKGESSVVKEETKIDQTKEVASSSSESELDSLISNCSFDALGRELHLYYQRLNADNLAKSAETSLFGSKFTSWKISGDRNIKSNEDRVVQIDEKHYGLIEAKITDNVTAVRFDNAIKKGFAPSSFGHNGVKVITKQSSGALVGYEVKIHEDSRVYTNKVYKNQNDDKELIVFDNFGNHSDVNNYFESKDLEVVVLGGE